MRLAAWVLVSFIASAGCSSEDAPAACDPKVEKGSRISSRGASLTICVGDTVELGFDLWECATNAEVTAFATWVSDKPGIAMVDRGVVRGVAAGTASITATYSGRSDSTQVTVKTCP